MQCGAVGGTVAVAMAVVSAPAAGVGLARSGRGGGQQIPAVPAQIKRGQDYRVPVVKKAIGGHGHVPGGRSMTLMWQHGGLGLVLMLQLLLLLHLGELNEAAVVEQSPKAPVGIEHIENGRHAQACRGLGGG